MGVVSKIVEFGVLMLGGVQVEAGEALELEVYLMRRIK